jgi:hypothetical protein
MEGRGRRYALHGRGVKGKSALAIAAENGGSRDDHVATVVERLGLSDEKKLSIAALSQTLPDRLIEQTTPWSAMSRWYLGEPPSGCSAAGAVSSGNPDFSLASILTYSSRQEVLSRKPRAMPAVARIFDGEREAKLIALACSKPPKGRARWTLRLLENKVVELGIVDRASDSTIGRAQLDARLSAAKLADDASAMGGQGGPEFV